MKRQLEIQADGLNGNLDLIWRDIRDSAYIGGDAEGWERVPYWLDGFIPLAYLLDNKDMISRARRYIDAIIASQKPDGWICPCKDSERAGYDTWALLLISKVLCVYYQCSADERIPDVLYRAMRNFYDLLKIGAIKLFDWGKYRWFEGFIAIEFLYERYNEDWLTDLARILKSQGTDYRDTEHLWKRPLNKWTLDTHIVNLAMMLKSEAVSCKLLGEEYKNDAEYYYQLLYKYNGMPVGIFTGDEVLSGLSPIQGAELCSVVEMMFSFEQLYLRTLNSKWAERLELIAFNALPASLSDDMWAHQYDQMSNQIACIRFDGKPIFRTNYSDSHLFGLEPNYGCCTANFGQGWPKLCLSAFIHNENTVINVIPIPCSLDSDKAAITVESSYPFNNSIKYIISAKKDFTFKIRIPSFAENPCVNGIGCSAEMPAFEIKSGENREITVTFDTLPEFRKSPCGMNYVRCGSIVYSVPIKYKKNMLEYERDGVLRKFPYCDYEYIPQSDWNYAYKNSSLILEQKTVGDIPFSSSCPPSVIKATVQKISWGFEDGYDTVCKKYPESISPVGAPETIELYPYGCAKLRMTELPVIE